MAIDLTLEPNKARRTLWLLPVLIVTSAMFVHGQSRAAEAERRPAYKSARFDEDWSSLKDPANRTDVIDPIKWIPLNGDGSWYVTLGGEVRERYESSDNRLFGLPARTKDDYLLHRLYLYGDVHFGQNLRTFVEIASGAVSGWDGLPPATQEDDLDLLQGFADIALPFGSGEMTLRGGRQELSFGSSRLVSVRDSPNIRRSFDGIKTAWMSSPGFGIEAFVARPVTPESEAFDDDNDPDQLFWGLYSTIGLPAATGSKADLYYFGLARDEASFAQDLEREERHTLGARLFGKSGDADWDVEGIYQFGSFGSANISAWAASFNIGYTVADLPLAPRLGLKADAISGDDDLDDATLGTFNPLFPKLPYFSEANLAAPANLLSLQPGLSFSPTPKVQLDFSWNPLWKQSAADAFYAPPLAAVKGTTGGSDRFIGQQFIVSGDWAATDRLTFSATYVRFEPGNRLKQIGGSAGSFFAVSSGWRF